MGDIQKNTFASNGLFPLRCMRQQQNWHLTSSAGCCSPQGERATVSGTPGGLAVLFKLTLLVKSSAGKELSRRGVVPFLPCKASYGQPHCSCAAQPGGRLELLPLTALGLCCYCGFLSPPATCLLFTLKHQQTVIGKASLALAHFLEVIHLL